MEQFDMDNLLNNVNAETDNTFEFDSDTQKYQKHQREYIDYMKEKKMLSEQLKDIKAACKDEGINAAKLIKGIRAVMEEMNETSEDASDFEKSYQAAKADPQIYADLALLSQKD